MSDYRDENIWLMKGDCLERMKEIPGGSVDMVLTDPPYGTTACKWDSVIPLEPMWEQLKRVVKPNGVIALTASQPFTSVLVTSNIRMFKHEWVWIKNRGSNFANTVREPMKEHEVVLIFSNGKWTYNKQMQERSGGGLDRVKYSFNDVGYEREGTRKFKGRYTDNMPESLPPIFPDRFRPHILCKIRWPLFSHYSEFRFP